MHQTIYINYKYELILTMLLGLNIMSVKSFCNFNPFLFFSLLGFNIIGYLFDIRWIKTYNF